MTTPHSEVCVVVPQLSGGAGVENLTVSLQIFVYVFTLFILSKWMLNTAKNRKQHFGGCCVASATDTTLTTQKRAERHFTGGRRVPWQHSELSVAGPNSILHIITKVRRPASEKSTGTDSAAGRLFWVHSMTLKAKRYFRCMAPVQANKQGDLSSALGKQYQQKKTPQKTEAQLQIEATAVEVQGNIRSQRVIHIQKTSVTGQPLSFKRSALKH